MRGLAPLIERLATDGTAATAGRFHPQMAGQPKKAIEDSLEREVFMGNFVKLYSA